MKSALVFVALVGYVSAAIVGYGAPVAHVLNTGASSQFRSQDNIGNYAFGYNEDHSTGGTFRREQGGPGVQVGSYGLRDADGRVRVVNYVADALGFRANVQSNEPGVEPKDPAAVTINKAVAVAPAVAVAAPLIAPAVAHSYVAPVAHVAPAQVASYSTVTQHVAAPAYAHAHVAAPLAAPLAYGAPAVSYATKTIHGGIAAPYYGGW